MPAHWEFKFENLPRGFSFVALALKFGIRSLCFISFGHLSLSDVWAICSSADEQRWIEITERFIDRLNAIVVVAGLLLGATAAFITTTAPLPEKFDFNEGGAYICLLLSFSASLGTLVVGSALVTLTSKCTREWFVDTHMGSASRIVCTMYIFAYPFLSMGASTSVAAVGLLVAAWSSKDGLIVKGAIWLFLFPATCLPAWWWIQRPTDQPSQSPPEGSPHPPDEETVVSPLSYR